jgi:hypothetical protein
VARDVGTDIPGKKYVNVLVDPDFIEELTFTIRLDDLDTDPRVDVTLHDYRRCE